MAKESSWPGLPVSASGLVTKGSLVINAADVPYGAVGDGVADDTAAIQAAINAAATSRGSVLLPAVHKVTASITVPANVEVRALGASAKVSVPAGFNFPVFVIDGVAARINGLRIIKASGAAAGANGNAVRITGNSDGASVTDVYAEGMSSGFYVAGWLGAVPGTAKRVVLTRCQSKDAAVFGFEFDNCDGVELANCVSNGSGLDGVKLRRSTKNIRVIGGYFTGAIGGDGMDCYAGGDTFVIDGAAFIANGLNGLVVKNDDLNDDGHGDPATYGIVRNLTVSNVLATGNGGSGIAIHRSSGNPDDPTEPLVSHVSVIGCQTHGNANYGMYLNARAVTVTGLQARRNGLDGFYMEPGCVDVTLVGVHTSGNSVTTPGARDGLHINGSHVRIIGGSAIGTDPDQATSDADLAAGTKTQRYGLRVEATATSVDVFGFSARYNLTADISDAANVVRWAGQMPGLPLIAGYYIAPGGTRATIAMAQSVEYAVPVYISQPGVITKLGCEVTAVGAAGTVVRLGVRANTGGLPGAPLGEVTVAGDATSPNGVEGTVSIAIPRPGLYWFTAVSQGGAATVRSCTGPTGMASGSPSLTGAVGATPNGGYLTANSVTGALPATYTVSTRAGALPLVVART
ncbi:right-handed parallel beta-helix repeat-containing protein [Dactylosporangium sp. CA-139066]|uniref:right-handed parallel beta-helix repeat-containing protein n=1 Tax=Dactylosporangium sp. CA-139066 TaxID=3239930 RepID=UPI003D945715